MKKVRDGFTHAGYVSSRICYDQFLFEQAAKHSLIRIIQGINIQQIKSTVDYIELTSKDSAHVIKAKLVVGADGAHSVLAKLLHHEIDKKHYSGGLRQYWEGVTGFDEGDPIELHFYKNTLPGYFWIFPMANNKANVGIGIKSDVISKKRINIKQVMDEQSFDVICFFTPSGVKSLFDNYPTFQQNNTNIGAFGNNTVKAVEEAGLKLEIKAPAPQAPSMVAALDKYLAAFGIKK